MKKERKMQRVDPYRYFEKGAKPVLCWNELGLMHNQVYPLSSAFSWPNLEPTVKEEVVGILCPSLSELSYLWNYRVPIWFWLIPTFPTACKTALLWILPTEHGQTESTTDQAQLHYQSPPPWDLPSVLHDFPPYLENINLDFSFIPSHSINLCFLTVN